MCIDLESIFPVLFPHTLNRISMYFLKYQITENPYRFLRNIPKCYLKLEVT